MELPQLIERFAHTFGHSPSGYAAAPGRVNLIGEHTDYNGGFVLPIAIERRVTALYAPRTDSLVRLLSVQMPEEAALDLTGPLAPGLPKWANYSKGVAAGLLARGLPLKGADILFDSTVPLGGGLSSSAALEVATGLALMAVAGQDGAVAGSELAKLCQKAEHDFAGAPVGIMDQSIAILGQAGCALLLDCRSNETQQIPFNDPNLTLLVADTQVKHELSDGGYAARRKQCESAAAAIGVAALRDVDEATVRAAGEKGVLAGKELMRARHVTGEIARTMAAVGALRAGNYVSFGELMYQSHRSLREDYEVSCEELDLIVDTTSNHEGVYGARMTGGGFGGCAIILAQAAHAAKVTATVQSTFAGRFGHPCPIFATHAAAGATVQPL